MSPEWISAAGTILLAVVTVILFVANLKHESTQRDRTARAIRTMLRLEIDDNTTRYHTFSNNIRTLVEERPQPPERSDSELGRDFPKFARPKWDQHIWISNSELLPKALSYDTFVIDETSRFYRQLDEISEIYDAGTRLLQLQASEATMDQKPLYRRTTEGDFEHAFAKLWNRWKQLRDALEVFQNPVK